MMLSNDEESKKTPMAKQANLVSMMSRQKESVTTKKRTLEQLMENEQNRSALYHTPQRLNLAAHRRSMPDFKLQAIERLKQRVTAVNNN